MGENSYICSMKSLHIRLVCLTLALLVTFGSIGLASTEHICLVTGMIMQAPTPEKAGCCPKKKATTPNQKLAFKKKCCAFSVSHYKVSPEAGHTFSSVKLPILFSCPTIRFIPDWLHLVAETKLLPAGFNKAPPLAGRTLLSFIHVLII